MSIKSWLKSLFRKDEPTVAAPKKSESLVDHFKNLKGVMESIRKKPKSRADLYRRVFPRTIGDMEITNCSVVGGEAHFSSGGKVWSFDSASQTPMPKSQYDDRSAASVDMYKNLANGAFEIPDEIWEFYAQSFLTWTACAQFAQHPLINRTCAIRGEDAVAVGFEIGYAETSENDEGANDYLAALMKATKRMGINEVLRKLDYNKCVFGIGIAVPTFDGDVDMSLPFNIDAKGLDTYTGYTVIDPYWLMPQFDKDAASDPSSKHFFKPTWWRLPNGKVIHRSWCFTCVNSHVADILKPSYIYGGIPLTQMIYERVFAADKCANEAPLLALTKRLLVVDANIQQVLADPKHVKDLMDVVTYCRTNWGVMFKQPTANINQIDTSLGEYDQLIMTQYQLVASIAQMPATKLLKVTPTGFQSTGEYEWKDWAQSLIDIQEMEFTPLLERHFQLLTKKRGGKAIAITVKFNPVDAPTEQEKATIQSTKAGTYSQLLAAGAVSVDEVRDILRNDEDGDFTGIGSDSPTKDEDVMAELAKRMDGGTKDELEVAEAMDDPDFERKHRRGRDGRFTRGDTSVIQSIVEYDKDRGSQVYHKVGGGKTSNIEEAKRDRFGRPLHVYAGVRAEGKPWTFPKKTQAEKAESRVLTKRNAEHYNGGDREPDLTNWKANKREVPFTGKTHLSEFKKKDLIIRSVKPKFGYEEVEKTVLNKKTGRKNKKVVRQPVMKSGKPVFSWSVGGRELSDKDAFRLEHALVNGGYGNVLNPNARDVMVRPDYANGVNEIVGSRATTTSDWKAVKDSKTARAEKDLHIAQIESVYEHADEIIDTIIDDFDNADDYMGVLAYFQLVSTCRVGSPGTDNGGAMDLMKDNVAVSGDTVVIDFDAKNGRWHTEFTDKALAQFFRNELPKCKPGERIFGTTDYGEYNEYLSEIGERFGIPHRVSGDGFTSHNLRHLSASLFASREVDKIKIDPKKDRDGYIAAIEEVVAKTANHVNDGAGTVFKSYIAPSALWKNAPWIYESSDRFTPPTGR